MASNDKISFLGKFVLAGSCDSNHLEAASVYVHLSRQSKRMELPWKFWRFKHLHLSLSLSTWRRRVERNIPGLSCRYHAFIDVYLIARGASYPAPQKYDRSPVVELIIIPPGFERERDGRGESGLHCYYNETRINTSRLYTRDRCNYLLMMIFVAVGGRGAPGDGGRVGGSQQQPPPPPPQFARPSDKLSEIMSQEIGSLARGWLTAGLPASSLPAALSPSFLKLPFTGLRTRLSRCVPKDRPIDLYTISFFLFLSAFLVSFENASKFRLVFTPSATYPAFACIICHSRGICC